ncbi:MAG: hypothetical protein QNJ51_25745 [Calothrix sp. MO_167.B12]|nr:hypothetical protein [Calothrix sp. MO_167.B12]
MAEPTLTAVFGDNVTQDGTTLTVAKADLPITASATNTGESLLVGLMLKAAENLNSNAQGVDPDIQVTIDRDSSAAITRNSQSYIRHLFLVRLDVPDQTQTVNADSF